MKNSSYWQAGFERNYPSLKRDIEVDVAIIGAGITGLTAAYLLSQQGKKVAVIDMGKIGSGETGRSSAHLTVIMDTLFSELVKTLGEEKTALLINSASSAIDFIEETTAKLSIDCDFQRIPGYWFAETAEQAATLDLESATLRNSGLALKRPQKVPLPFAVKSARRIEHQARFHPLKYLHGIANHLAAAGHSLYENTAMIGLEEGDSCIVQTSEGRIKAGHVVEATNIPTTFWVSLQTKMAAYRSYIVMAKVRSPELADALYWNLDDPYQYLRLTNSGPSAMLILGGADHKTGADENTEHYYNQVKEYLFSHFGTDQIEYRWSGQIIESVDGLPYVGWKGKNGRVGIAAGYSGTGLTFGTLAAHTLVNELAGLKYPWGDLFDADRLVPLRDIPKYLEENIDFPLHFIKDRFVAPKEISAVAPGHGAVLPIGGKKVAVYRAENGELNFLSPVCPHLGCYVSWNGAEKSWDCPCHGSRFSCEGKMLNGPALSDLSPLEDFVDPTLTPIKKRPSPSKIGANSLA